MSGVISNSNVLNLTSYSSEQSARKVVEQNESIAVNAVPKVTENAAVSVMSKENLNEAINTLNKVPAIQERNLSFSVDDLSGRSVIKLRDKKTDEVIKQIPSEELLKVAQDVRRLQEQMGQSVGFLVDNKV